MFRRIAVLAALAMAAGGCIWNRARVNDAAVAERAAGIVPGETRAEELPGILGAAPSAVIPLRDGRMVYAFSYGDAKTEGVSLILVTLTKTNSSFSAVYVFVDGEGVVRAVERSPAPAPRWETWPFGA